MHTAINKHFSNTQYFGFTGTPGFKDNKSQDGRVTNNLFEKCLHTYLIKDAIDTDEVFMNDERISLVANHIIKNHPGKPRNMEYTSIFTVQGIQMLIKYYDKFKELNHNLKIAGIFTSG